MRAPYVNAHGRLVVPEIKGPGPDASQIDRAAWAIADALNSPVSPQGTVYDLRFVNIPVIAYHLARAGIGPVEGQAVIRGVDAPGGYRQWVGVDDPDPELIDIENTPISQLDPEDPRVKAMIARRFGGDQFKTPPPPDGWRVRPSINLEESV